MYWKLLDWLLLEDVEWIVSFVFVWIILLLVFVVMMLEEILEVCVVCNFVLIGIFLVIVNFCFLIVVFNNGVLWIREFWILLV